MGFVASEQFGRFLDRVRGLDWKETVRAAEAEQANNIPGKRGQDDDRLQKNRYLVLIGEFLFFLRYAARPAGIDMRRFQLFFPVCESLVARGELRPAVLNLFTQGVGPR
jgi:hypothetical protein